MRTSLFRGIMYSNMVFVKIDRKNPSLSNYDSRNKDWFWVLNLVRMRYCQSELPNLFVRLLPKQSIFIFARSDGSSLWFCLLPFPLVDEESVGRQLAIWHGGQGWRCIRFFGSWLFCYMYLCLDCVYWSAGLKLECQNLLFIVSLLVFVDFHDLLQSWRCVLFSPTFSLCMFNDMFDSSSGWGGTGVCICCGRNTTVAAVSAESTQMALRLGCSL
jgi:hypothetical protein